MAYQFDFSPVLDSWDTLAAGLWLSIRLAAIAMALGTAAAITLAVGKLSGVRWLRLAIDAYIELIRNTPLLVQVFFVFFGLPALGIRFTPDTAATIALTVNAAAYATEIIRAGIESVGRGQIEAGLAVGLHRLQVFRHVVLVPALRAVFPALTSQFNVVLLSTSIVSAISANELTHEAEYINSLTYRSFEVYITVGVIYFVTSWLFSLLFATIHRTIFAYPDAH
ncbi:MAG: amino acid ABC transporter permease [Acetobacteraceae bacterium]|nr:amino acid ABC transporter permease [Acetobacteraceae bacterium]